MKRNFLIIFLFLILFTCCFFEELFLKNNLELLNAKALNLKEVVLKNSDVNSEEVSNEILNLENFWNKTENYFCIVVNHINMEEAGEQISKIKSYSYQNKKDEILVEIDLLIYYSESYKHIIVPNIQNIL